MAIAVWLALLLWLLEAAALTAGKLFFHQRNVWSVQTVWLSAVAYVGVFAALGVALHLWVRRASSPRRERIACGVLLAIAALFALLLIEGLGRSAALLLAIGIGFQASAWIGARGAAMNRLVRTTLPALAAVVTPGAATAAAFGPWQEWRAESRLGAAREGAPNVILIILDTVRAMSLSAYDYDRPTSPRLEALAARGVQFERAFAPAPWTLPTHLSLFSGLSPDRMADPYTAGWNRALPPGQPVLAEVLAARGYATGGFVANLSYMTREFGFARGFARYEDFPVSLGQLVVSTAPGRAFARNGRWRRLLDRHEPLTRKPADRIVASFLDWQARQDDLPFFAFLNFFDAHVPYRAYEPFASRFVSRWPPARYYYRAHGTNWLTKTGMDESEFRAWQDMYEASIAGLDDRIGSLLDELERRGVLDNTLFIVTSDHGEGFAEHGRLGHGPDLYLPSVHVPLILSFPGRAPAGGRVRTPVTLTDLPATVLDLLGLPASGIPGRSIAALWRAGADTAGRSVIPMQTEFRGGKKAILRDRWHYISNPNGTAELYDVGTDPLEQQNLAALPRYGAVVARMRMELKRQWPGTSPR